MCSIDVLKNQLDKLGKYRTGKSCLYIRNLAAIDTVVLRTMLRDSLEELGKSSHVIG